MGRNYQSAKISRVIAFSPLSYTYLEKRADACKTTISVIVDEIIQSWIADQNSKKRRTMEEDDVTKANTSEEIYYEEYSTDFSDRNTDTEE
jgi:hypothetical protein